MQLKKCKRRTARRCHPCRVILRKVRLSDLTIVSMTRNFDRSRTEAQLRRATRYRERYAWSVDRTITGLQIYHLLEVRIVVSRRCIRHASAVTGDVAGPKIIFKML